MIDPADHLAIERVITLYTFVVDGRHWDQLGEVFTEDAIFDASAHGVPTRQGIEALRASWSATPPGRYHHTTGIIITPETKDSARVLTKSIGIMFSGEVGGGMYEDKVVRTPKGWRIAVRRAIPAADIPNVPIVIKQPA